MRPSLILLFLFAQLSSAADCYRVVSSPSPPRVVLSGVIEYQRADPPEGLEVKDAIANLFSDPGGSPTSFQTVLKLTTPICLEGTARDGFHFKKEHVESIVLGIPANLMGTLLPLDRVTLHGEFWGPAVTGGPVDDVMFAVREIL